MLCHGPCIIVLFLKKIVHEINFQKPSNILYTVRIKVKVSIFFVNDNYDLNKSRGDSIGEKYI
jgi:hypothetical protein